MGAGSAAGLYSRDNKRAVPEREEEAGEPSNRATQKFDCVIGHQCEWEARRRGARGGGVVGSGRRGQYQIKQKTGCSVLIEKKQGGE